MNKEYYTEPLSSSGTKKIGIFKSTVSYTFLYDGTALNQGLPVNKRTPDQ